MISVILPSIRPSNLYWAISRMLDNQLHTDFEIITVTDFVVEDYSDRVVRLYQPECKGVIHAINQGIQRAHGEYIYVTNDQSNLSPDGLNQLVKYSNQYGDDILTGPRDVENFQFKYYDRWFVAYPFVSRKTLQRIGGHFDTSYKAFYADPDMSMRAHDNGVLVQDCPFAINKRYHGGLMNYDGHQEACNKYFAQDKQTFISRWSKFGEYKDC